MAPKRRSSKKTTAKSSDDDNIIEEGRKDSKRRCSTSAITASSASVKKEDVDEDEEVTDSDRSNINLSITQADVPDPVASTATEPTSNTVQRPHGLPTPAKLSREVCKIISDRYSPLEALDALERLFKWAGKKDPVFLQTFYIHAYVLTVFDFLKAKMNESNYVGLVRVNCIHKATRVIMCVCDSDSNKEIATNISSSALSYNGIETLLNASAELLSGGKDAQRLEALACVWGALKNINITCWEDISDFQKKILFDTGISILVDLKSCDHPFVSRVLEDVFITFDRCNYMEKEPFQNTNILSKCVDIFQKDGIFGHRNAAVTSAAICFFTCCRNKGLFDRGADYEMLLPFLTMCVKKFGSVKIIIMCALLLIHEACDRINDKKTIERPGIVEHLGALLTCNDILEEQKNNVRRLIVWITSP